MEKKLVKLYNRGSRTFNTEEGILKPGTTCEVSQELADKFLKNYPTEFVHFSNSPEAQGGEVMYLKNQLADAKKALEEMEAKYKASEGRFQELEKAYSEVNKELADAKKALKDAEKADKSAKK